MCLCCPCMEVEVHGIREFKRIEIRIIIFSRGLKTSLIKLLHVGIRRFQYPVYSLANLMNR